MLGKKKRKIITIITSIIIIITLGFVVYSLVKREKLATNVETSAQEEHKIKSLASKAGYKMFSFEERDFILVIPEESLEEEKFKNFIKEIYDYGSEAKEEYISFQVFSDEQHAKKLENFYEEGLLKDVKMDFKTNKVTIGTFEKVPAIEKSEFINDYSQGKVISKDGHIIITMDMTFQGENPTNVVSNAKAFCDLFKASNPSKNINGIELHLNEDSDTNQYRFNSLFEEVLEKIEVVNY